MRSITVITLTILSFFTLACHRIERANGWYLINDGQKDSLSTEAIVTVDDFRGLLFDSLQNQNKEMFYIIRGGISSEKTPLFAEATRTNVGKRLAFLSNGKVISSPTINGEINHGNWEIVLKDFKQAFQLYLSLLEEMGSAADEILPDPTEAAMEEPISIIPNTTPISFKQHNEFTNLVAEIIKRHDAEQGKGLSPDIRTYPEFNQIVTIGKPAIVPLLFIMIAPNNQYLLSLYDALQDKELCSELPLTHASEKMEETLTLFVEKVLKQKRHHFDSKDEKLRAIKDLMKQTNSMPDTVMWDAEQMDSILLTHDYDLFKAIITAKE